MNENEILIKGMENLNIFPTEKQIEQLNDYYNILIEWNKVMNLTAITEYKEVIVKHFLDSLVLGKVYDVTEDKNVIDMGTGAGFPGIPLKIMFPNLNITLMDSLNKRIKFLDEVILKLGLNGITAIHARAEELGRNEEYRESFDLCVSRAVARLASLSEFCIPFVKKGGFFIPYKAGNISEELIEAKNAIKTLGCEVVKEESFVLPFSDVERTLIVIKKTKQTPKTYPRAGGKPLNTPIK